MICPECGGECPAKDARCGNCGYEFVFAPEVDGTSDADWLELVRFASSNGRHYFRENTLYLGYARGRVQINRYISKRGKFGLVGIAVGLITWVCALKADWGLTLVAGIFVTLSGVAMVGTGVITERIPAPRERISRWLHKWQTRKPLAKLLTGPELADAGLEYSAPHIECLVIVQHDVLADLLLKNGAQRELSALIVAESGYPRALYAEAQRILAERPELKVIALHDATPSGVLLCSRLLGQQALPLEAKTLVDAGLFPAEVTQFADLASAIPPNRTTQVPLDSLRYETLLEGLRAVTQGGISILDRIAAARSD